MYLKLFLAYDTSFEYSLIFVVQVSCDSIPLKAFVMALFHPQLLTPWQMLLTECYHHLLALQKWRKNETSIPHHRIQGQFCSAKNVIWVFCMMWLFCYAKKWHPHHKSWYATFAVQNMIRIFCLHAGVALWLFSQPGVSFWWALERNFQ